MTTLADLAAVHNRLDGLPRLTPVRLVIGLADLPEDLARKDGWARLASRVVWTAAEPSVPLGEAIAAEWVEGGASFRLRLGPAGRTLVKIEEVAAGGEEMLREEVRVMARGFGGPPPGRALLYHVYWGLDATGAIDRMFDAFMGVVETGA